MKTPQTFFLFLFLCLLITACQPTAEPMAAEATPTIDYDKEQAAIMAVIDGESAAFWNKDYEKWASYWVHESYIRTMGWWDAGGVTVVAGWDERAQRTKAHMEESPEPNATASEVIRKNVNIRIFNEVAWLTFDQYGADTGDSLMDMPGLSRESRILEKHDGEWKIAYVGWLLEEPTKKED